MRARARARAWGEVGQGNLSPAWPTHLNVSLSQFDGRTARTFIDKQSNANAATICSVVNEDYYTAKR